MPKKYVNEQKNIWYYLNIHYKGIKAFFFHIFFWCLDISGENCRVYKWISDLEWTRTYTGVSFVGFVFFVNI